MSEKQVKISKRAPNYTNQEKEMLVTLICENYDKIFGAFSSKLTFEDKDKIWTEICDKVNSVSKNARSKNDMKDKWKSLKRDTKAKAAEIARSQRKTGGGEEEAEDLDSLEEIINGKLTQCEMKIFKKMGTMAILGVSGGIDTSQSALHSTPIVLNLTRNEEEGLDVSIFDTMEVGDGDAFALLNVLPEISTPTTSTKNIRGSPLDGTGSNKNKKRKMFEDEHAIGNSMLELQEKANQINDGILIELKELNKNFQEFIDLKKKKYNM